MLGALDVAWNILVKAAAPARPHTGLCCLMKHDIAVINEVEQLAGSEVERNETEGTTFVRPFKVPQLQSSRIVVVEAISTDTTE